MAKYYVKVNTSQAEEEENKRLKEEEEERRNRGDVVEEQEELESEVIEITCILKLKCCEENLRKICLAGQFSQVKHTV